MFGNATGAMLIGERNAEAVVRGLHAASIRIGGQDTGGTKGRRVIFDCATGVMTIAIAGQKEQTL